MADRKRRNEESNFQPPTFRALDSNKRGRTTVEVATRSLSRSTSRSTSSSCIDDSIGHMNAVRGDVLVGRYEVQRELGTGTFGKVFQCHDRKYNQKVAVKVVRSIKRYVESALIEGAVLDAVYSRQKREKTDFCVKMFSHFNLNDHYCLVFETLGISLYDLIKRNDYIGFPLRHVKDLARQLLGAMDFLSNMRLIHTDLKLENILFQNSDNMTHVTVTQNGKKKEIQVPPSFKIKIIDFGGATFDDEHKSTIINTRQYRGPEVTLEAGWSFPSDIWSVGCMIAEIYSGELFFQTHDDVEHIALMERCIGPFPFTLIDRAKRSKEYFQRNGFTRHDALSSDSRDHVASALTVQEFFSLNPGDSSSGLLEFMTALLELEPMKRGEFDRSNSFLTDRELLYDQRRRGEEKREDRGDVKRMERRVEDRRVEDRRVVDKREDRRIDERREEGRGDDKRGEERERRNRGERERFERAMKRTDVRATLTQQSPPARGREMSSLLAGRIKEDATRCLRRETASRGDGGDAGRSMMSGKHGDESNHRSTADRKGHRDTRMNKISNSSSYGGREGLTQSSEDAPLSRHTHSADADGGDGHHNSVASYSNNDDMNMRKHQSRIGSINGGSSSGNGNRAGVSADHSNNQSYGAAQAPNPGLRGRSISPPYYEKRRTEESRNAPESEENGRIESARNGNTRSTEVPEMSGNARNNESFFHHRDNQRN